MIHIFSLLHSIPVPRSLLFLLSCLSCLMALLTIQDTHCLVGEKDKQINHYHGHGTVHGYMHKVPKKEIRVCLRCKGQGQLHSEGDVNTLKIMTACFFLLPSAYSWRISFCCCSVTKLCLTLWPRGLQHTRLPCPSLTPGVCSNSCPLSWWCHPTISCSPAFFSLRTFSASGSFPMSQLFAASSIGASASVLPMNIQGWSPLGLTGWISLLSKRLSRVFSNTTIWKHQFLGTQPSLWSNSDTHTWLLEKP